MSYTLPAVSNASGWDVVSIGGLGSFGYYWSSSPNGSSNVFYMNFANGGKGVYGVGRNYGYSVRGVVG